MRIVALFIGLFVGLLPHNSAAQASAARAAIPKWLDGVACVAVSSRDQLSTIAGPTGPRQCERACRNRFGMNSGTMCYWKSDLVFPSDGGGTSNASASGRDIPKWLNGVACVVSSNGRLSTISGPQGPRQCERACRRDFADRSAMCYWKANLVHTANGTTAAVMSGHGSVPKWLDGVACVTTSDNGLDTIPGPRGPRQCARACARNPDNLNACHWKTKLVWSRDDAGQDTTPDGVRTTTGTNYELAWRDEFNSLQLSTNRTTNSWLDHFGQFNVRHLAGNNDEGVKLSDGYRLPNGQTVSQWLAASGRWGRGPHFLHHIRNGTLTMRTYPAHRRSDVWGFPYLGSMISGQNLHSQTYGYWEIRLRMRNLPKGHHMAFWLLPDDASWPPEVDMAEFVAQTPNTLYTNLHITGGGDFFRQHRLANGSDRWIKVGFEWTPAEMIWTVDGQVVNRQRNRVNGKRMYFLASWEIGGNWPGNPDGTTSWPGEAEIDYVRIYRRQ